MTEKQKPTLPSGQTMTWKNVDHPSVYANIMGFSMSAFDISFIFGEINEATLTEVAATPKVKVTLSPEQASNLMKMLSVVLAEYQRGNGPLRTIGAVDEDKLIAQIEAQKVVVPE